MSQGRPSWRPQHFVLQRAVPETNTQELGEGILGCAENVPPHRYHPRYWRPPRQRAVERYDELLRVHVVPQIGEKRLQALMSTDIDALYRKIEEAETVALRTQEQIHSVLNACLAAAVRTGKINANPMDRVQKVPDAGDDDETGQALDEEQLEALVKGFKKSTLFPIVAIATLHRRAVARDTGTAMGRLRSDHKDATGRACDRRNEGARPYDRTTEDERGIRTNVIDDNLVEPPRAG